ncbi:MAG: Asp-tRNA(Asn)/Glu-tRNA(Gln) amidotransferase subunit GatB [Spirosomaceae bacterium]|jgi:aspartyl-tRNA(Asn)/glutamyl-tRNA(Gln) amidotransferase subunit B|nr:Asp-tRNA(Asn)/Glu-tRNA(Gln) amidotransferase subunit GatB [Spirosomataceae bacterium]
MTLTHPQTQYEIVIGLEVHCQLQTQTKIFAADANQFGCEPNTNISVITLAHPGTLPKLNKKAVEYAVRMGIACGCNITQHTIFDRKNYFYPDLPKGYQLSQDKAPICVGGAIAVRFKDKTGQNVEKTVKIHHIHLEEDAGKSVHDGSDTDTLLDYNRAGTPLIEMVTDPCIGSAEEAGAFLTAVRQLVRFIDICDGNMEEGSLRCDLNISVRPQGATYFGTKVEVKNMNSIRNVMKAVETEYKRQVAMVERGEPILQETRMFDPETGETFGMRVKETMNDYRYFPEPDLAPVFISDEWMAEIEQNMPPVPQVMYERFTRIYKLSPQHAATLTDTKDVALYFEELSAIVGHFQIAANWVLGPVKMFLNENPEATATQYPLSPRQLSEVIKLVEANQISHTTATQKLLPILLENPAQSPLELAQQNNWLQNSNADALESIIDDVLASMPEKLQEYRKGKKGLLGLFVGEVMKKTKGSADPKVVNQLLAKKLG